MVVWGGGIKGPDPPHIQLGSLRCNMCHAVSYELDPPRHDIECGVECGTTATPLDAMLNVCRLINI